ETAAQSACSLIRQRATGRRSTRSSRRARGATRPDWRTARCLRTPAATPTRPRCHATCEHPSVARGLSGIIPLARRLLHVLEEVRARIEHHDVVLLLEAFLVSVEAAVEVVKFRRLTVRGGVNRSRAGVAFAADLLRLAICRRQ